MDADVAAGSSSRTSTITARAPISRPSSHIHEPDAAPARALRKIFAAEIARLMSGLPANAGRELLVAFLTRYYVTRLQKHREQKKLEGGAWAVYE
jgi:hypothetical protein